MIRLFSIAKRIIIVLMMALALIVVVLSSSCTSYKRCTELYGVTKGDTVFICYEREVPFSIASAADSAKLAVDMTDLYVNGEVITSDTSGTIVINTSYDPITNKLNISAKAKPKTLTGTVLVKEKIACPPKLYLEKPPTWGDKITRVYRSIAAWGFPFLFTFVLIMLREAMAQWTRRKS